MTTIETHQIKKLIPHRYPFLLVDRVLSMTTGESIHAIKNVTANEPFFQGHFPVQPVMPGVLMIEALAQAAGILQMTTMELPENHGQIFFLAGVDGARFKRVVSPGDTLDLHVSIDRVRRVLWSFHAEAKVGDEVACSAKILIVERDANDS